MTFLPAHPRRAFTLVEMLVVIGLIALLLSFLLPMINRVRESANTTVCLSNMHQVGLALHLYAIDNDGTLPFVNPNLHLQGLGGYGVGGGPSPALGDGKGGAVIYDEKYLPYVPAPQNRPLNKYMAASIYNDTIDGKSYNGVYHYDIWKCPSDCGVDYSAYWPGSSLLPTVYEWMGVSFIYNDFTISAEMFPTIDHSDYADSVSNRRKISAARQAAILIAFYEPPAKPACSGVSDGIVFRWHNASNQTGSYDWKKPGSAGFYSNVTFFDGHAETVDFSAAYQRDATGGIVKYSERATSKYAWYLTK